MNRLPVKYKGIPLMPMKNKRVNKYIQLGKGKIRYDRKLKIHYLQLLEEPSGYATQEIKLGLDPGSSFDGISVVSDDTHHVNIELIHRAKKGKTSIKTFKARQAMNRRIRRSRLRHRPIRFDNRTKNKLPPTIKANVEFRKWIISKLTKIFPISKIVIEDVKFNHYKSKKSASFSLVEQGKNELYNWIKKIGLTLETYNGFNTKKLRVNSFGFDPKVSNKGDKSFAAHCIDSFVLACNKGNIIDKETGEVLMDEPIITNELKVNNKVIFIEKVVKIRRCLITNKKKIKNSKLLSGGEKSYYSNFSSHRNLCRVKPEGEHSNHPKEWKWIDNGFSERFKHFTSNYGGTVFNGVKKFWTGNEWLNRKLS
jgi:hypothetical protein